MTNIRHLHALALAAVLLVGGEYVMMLGKLPAYAPSLRGNFAETLEQKTNDTIDAWLSTIREESAGKKDLTTLVERLKDVEAKVEPDSSEKIAKKKDVDKLQDQVLKLNQKIRLHGEKEKITKDDLAPLEERISSFESRLETNEQNDLESLHERVAAFESKMQEDIVTQSDLETLKDLISSVEGKIESVETALQTQDATNQEETTSERPVKKPKRVITASTGRVKTGTVNGQPDEMTDESTNDGDVTTTKKPKRVITATAGRVSTANKVDEATIADELPAAEDTAVKKPKRVITASTGRKSKNNEATTKVDETAAVVTSTGGDKMANKPKTVITASAGRVSTANKEDETIKADEPVAEDTAVKKPKRVITASTGRKSKNDETATKADETAAVDTSTGGDATVKKSKTVITAGTTKADEPVAEGTAATVKKPKRVITASTGRQRKSAGANAPSAQSSSILNEQELKLLETFNPEHAPIMGNTPADINNPVRVRMVRLIPKKRTIRVRKGNWGYVRDEMINIVYDGFERSPYFSVMEANLKDHYVNPDYVILEQNDVVWVVDETSNAAPSYSLYSVDEEVLLAAQKAVNYQQSLAKKPTLKVVFVNYSDKIAGQVAQCSAERQKLIELLGEGNVRHVVGKVVAGRQWNEDDNWTEKGTIWDNQDYTCHGRPTLRAPYAVRSDIVEEVERLFPKLLPGGASVNEMTPADTVRPVDVWHHWDATRKEDRKKEYRKYSHLRNVVSETVLSLNGMTVGGRVINAKAESISEGGSVGRTKTSEEFLESLLKTKIVVVAQRDAWEDHYRLFEAIAGGAMVMTDQMISLPEGLVDGESVVMYRSQEHLKELLLRYLDPNQDAARLAIARKGFEVAMERHRAYHRMEELFFGSPLSPASLPHDDTKNDA